MAAWEKRCGTGRATASCAMIARIMNLPGALLLDLDDTILDSYSDPDEAWLQLCHEFAASLGTVTPRELHAAVMSARDWLWDDSERARRGRLDLPQARRDIVLRAFASLDVPDSPIAGRMADRYTTIREEAVRPFPGAIDTLRRLSETGIRLGLITNGAADMQRGKVHRFALGGFFEHIQVEEELGVGKPDEQAFRHALDALGVGTRRGLDGRGRPGVRYSGRAAGRHLRRMGGRPRRRASGRDLGTPRQDHRVSFRPCRVECRLGLPMKPPRPGDRLRTLP